MSHLKIKNLTIVFMFTFIFAFSADILLAQNPPQTLPERGERFKRSETKERKERPSNPDRESRLQKFKERQSNENLQGGERSEKSERPERTQRSMMMRDKMQNNQECTDFRNEVILPQFIVWKNKIDKSLNPQDLAKLEELRVKAREFKDSRPSFDKDNPDKSALNMKNMKETRKERMAQLDSIIQQLQPIIDNNSNLVDEILKEYNAKTQEWFNTRKENCAMSIPEFRHLKHQNDEASTDSRRRVRANGATDNEFVQNKIAQYRIFLCDGQEYYAENIMSVKIDTDKYIQNLQTTPNPFNDVLAISFDLIQSGSVVIQITDVKGNTLKEIQNGVLNQGTHSFKYSPDENLASGSYMYSVNFEGIIKTGNIVYQK